MIHPHASELAPASRQYLVFRLGTTSYGIPFVRVAEVCTLHATMPVLHAPAYDCGTVLLHGRQIPVLDLRSMVDAPRTLTLETRLIVAWVTPASAADLPLGLLVDAVTHVETYAPEDITPRPDFGPDIDTRFLAGTVTSAHGPRLLFDVNHLLPAALPHFLSETAHFLATGAPALRSDHNRPIFTG